MQVNVAGVRRNLKNLAHNYTDAQVKVREATSNDPWGPTCTLMAEIADLTKNVLAFSEIMAMIWKRLNDHGKNWRHVYKALTLLEYLIKTGDDKVLHQCKENIYFIHTLKDFQYFEESKDQGLNVREKAKALVNLLNDEEKLKNERAKAIKAKERFTQNGSGFGSDGAVETITLSPPMSPSGREYGGNWSGSTERHARAEATNKEIECARPQTVGEEELQLQLALAMSREEAEQEEQRRKSDDVRLQLALSQSQNELKTSSPPQSSSHMLDLLDVSLGAAAAAPPAPVLDPWGMPKRPQADPWSPTAASALSAPTPVGAVAGADPWAPIAAPQPVTHSPVPVPPPSVDPWRPAPAPAVADPWSPLADKSPVSPDADEFDLLSSRDRPSNGGVANRNGHGASDAFDLTGLAENLNEKSRKKSPHAFLGENSGLVNLENLVTVSPKPQPTAFNTANPFGAPPPAPPTATNLFQQQIPPRPSLNQLNQLQQQGGRVGDGLPPPLSPSPNPFLS